MYSFNKSRFIGEYKKEYKLILKICMCVRIHIYVCISTCIRICKEKNQIWKELPNQVTKN